MIKTNDKNLEKNVLSFVFVKILMFLKFLSLVFVKILTYIFCHHFLLYNNPWSWARNQSTVASLDDQMRIGQQIFFCFFFLVLDFSKFSKTSKFWQKQMTKLFFLHFHHLILSKFWHIYFVIIFFCQFYNWPKT